MVCVCVGVCVCVREGVRLLQNPMVEDPVTLMCWMSLSVWLNVCVDVFADVCV